MAIIGLCKPYYAIYTFDGTDITYSNGGYLGKAVEMSMDLDTGDDNILYADNAPAEKEANFSGGTITVTTDDLQPTAAAAVLGLTLTAVSNTGITDTSTPVEMIFGESQTVPYCGLGIVVKKRINNATKWLGVVWPKVQFENPNASVSTQGETIEWQTPEISATIFRDDSSARNWRRESLLDSEADAIAYVTGLLTTT